MRLPRVRFTVRLMMVAVAVAALVSLVASNSYRHDGITDKRVVIPVASVVAAVYGLGAMRRPLMFLLPLLAVWIATPQVDHPRTRCYQSFSRRLFPRLGHWGFSRLDVPAPHGRGAG